MPPRKRDTKAVARSQAAEPRRSGRAATSSADVAKQSGLAMSTPKSEASSRARTPRRPAARGKWSEEQLLTSDKSVLIDLDLVRGIALTKAISATSSLYSPPDVHPEAQATLDDPDAKIQPIPDSFIRYSNNWRDGIRQFQIDLQNGRYDPEWLRQAQEARQQRDNGDFDDFKEREYEQFWGQKQKVIWDAPAGESARVKMGTLIDEGVIQLGDVWKFYYVYGRGPGRIVIEKEVRVVDRDGVKLTFAIPPGERVFLRSNFDKSEPFSTPDKGKGDVEADLDTQPQPVTSSYNDKQLKHEKPESQVTNQTSNGEEVKLDTDQAPHETPASSNDEEMKLDNGRTPHEIPISSTDDMNIDTGTATQPVISHPGDEESQQEAPFSVVIFSPGGTRNQKPKRTIPEPEPQPPVKRKRGRPRKIPPKQPEQAKEPEVPQEVEVSQGEEQNTDAPLSFMEIVAGKIEENETRRAAAESPQRKPSQPQSPLSTLSSTPELPAPELSTSVEGPSIADTNGNDGKVELLESSMAQSDTPMDSSVATIEAPVEAPTEVPAVAPVEAEQDEINKPLSTEEQKDPIQTPSRTTTSEPDEIIVPDLSSPQALVRKILQIDGRMPNGRTANAWKEIRCYRSNQDMGSLFDVREAWFLQHGRHE
ncbi:hypothetical protein N7524_011194 [Penicillium chrysogenum]|nr:hypothetical protein N7524_011194 [Penicillium chrysogenum]